MYSTALNQKGNHFAIRLFLEKLNAYYFSCLFHIYEIYSSGGQTIKTKLLTQKQSKNLFFSNNVNIIQTQKNEIQGTSCKVNQTRARAHAHTHTHTHNFKFNFPRFHNFHNVISMSFYFEPTFSKNLKKKLSAM